MQIKTITQLERIIDDMDYSEITKFARNYNGSFLSLVRPLSKEDVSRFDQMVGKYNQLNYSSKQLEQTISTYEKLSGIDIVKLMAYIRPDNTQHKQKKSIKRITASIQS